ncbi:hypothetical protein KORDIASMS9_00487 [Kordia sp. SMS9]|uniref:hypothetical protein n=1 Tax=Kordia sp. SMS9 TaxID=2282170 RepID=UPI000E0D6BCF|nr:hypothetical protein [Kordia sp. SMS9]AXG68294.1 hypothetical protein KORDIASMS9_00487 [Kordia sp. SMS9]
MKVLSYTKYIYLLVAALSIFKVIAVWQADGTVDYLFVAFTVVSLFMFFFRRHYEKKFQDYKKDNNDQ